MKTLILDRGDFRTDLHPRMWEDVCDQLDVEPYSHDPDVYPDRIEVVVCSAKADD